MTSGIDARRVSIIMFSLFSSWMLAFPFQGQVFYAIFNRYNQDPHTMIFGSVVAHFIGLIGCGVFIKSMKAAKRLMLFSFIFLIAGTGVFLFTPSILWKISLLIMAALAGTCVAAWGFYFKFFTPSNERIKTAADVLIFSNILMILLNMVAVHWSPDAGLGLAMFFLAAALFLLTKLPEDGQTEVQPAVNKVPNKQVSKSVSPAKPLAFLYLFIFVITINSGLMYQVINPAFAHHEWLVSWYWALPYIIALYIMKNLPREISRTYILYVAIAMMGFAFIAFMTFERSVASYLIVDTLMLGACGVYDLFWWSILGEMLDLDENPARIFGIGLSANVLGVLLGGMLGNAFTAGDVQTSDPAVLALVVIFIILIILPLLLKQLSMVLKNHAYLTALSEMSAKETAVMKDVTLIGQLTERESEIAGLLLKGRTYKMIADELFLSENTVKTHIKNIYAKFNVQSKVELINLLREKDPSDK